MVTMDGLRDGQPKDPHRHGEAAKRDGRHLREIQVDERRKLGMASNAASDIYGDI